MKRRKPTSECIRLHPAYLAQIRVLFTALNELDETQRAALYTLAKMRVAQRRQWQLEPTQSDARILGKEA